MQVSETVQTIIEQATAQGVRAETLVILSDDAIRFHTKRGRMTRNVDVTYVPATDTYSIAVYEFSMSRLDERAHVPAETFEYVFADSLGEIIKSRPLID